CRRLPPAPPRTWPSPTPCARRPPWWSPSTCGRRSKCKSPGRAPSICWEHNRGSVPQDGTSPAGSCRLVLVVSRLVSVDHGEHLGAITIVLRLVLVLLSPSFP